MAEKIDPGSESLTKLPGTEGYQRVLPRCKPGRYAVKKFHARGGMGEVWQADDLDIGRPVALKRLRVERSDQAERFLAEAQISGQLEHPGIVPVHDLGTDEDNQPFYIMSFVGGRTLKDVVADYYSPNPSGTEPREVQRLRLLEAFVKLCQTVDYAHSKGVIHRDLKPDNIMLGPYGETVVLDWGLAKIKGRPEEPAPAGYVHLTYGGSSTATQYGTVIGAPPYMAPEEAEGKAAEADERTDVYLLGGTLYEILTGRAPRQGSSKDEMIELARTVPPVPPRKVNPQVPRALDAICMRALAHRKQDRYASAGELAQEVQRYLAGEPVAACPESFAQRAWRWCKRHQRGLGWVTTTVVVVGLGALGIASLQTNNRRRHEAEARAALMERHEDAGKQVAKFRALADTLHFQSPGTEGANEEVFYYDSSEGVKAGQEAVKIARGWGKELEELTLSEKDAGRKAELKAELYAVLLLLPQVKSERDPGTEVAAEMLDLLEWAKDLGGPSRSLHQLREECYRRLKRDKDAAEEERLAGDRATPETALDHFLQGEKLRRQEVSQRAKPIEKLRVRPDRQLINRAVVEYQAALEKRPNHYWAQFQLARCQLSLGQSKDAIMALGACLLLRPEVPWCWSTRGIARIRLGQFQEGLRDLDRALALKPGFQPALLHRGAMYWRQKKYDNALETLQSVTLTEADYYRGLILLEQRKYAEALKALDGVVAKKADFAPAHLARARARFALSQDESGLASLDSYLAGKGPWKARSPEAYELRGKLLRRLLAAERAPQIRRRLAQLAVQQLREAEKFGRRTTELYRELGSMFDNLKQADTAIQYYTSGLEIEPQHARLLLKRGTAYTEHLKNHKLALVDLTRAAQLADGQPDAAIIRAEAHTWLGIVHARQHSVTDANAEAALALLSLQYRRDEEGAENYLLIHNVACIYGELALVEKDPDKKKVHEDMGLEHLRGAIAAWRRSDTKGANEIERSRNEPSFASLKERPEFKKLTESAKK